MTVKGIQLASTGGHAKESFQEVHLVDDLQVGEKKNGSPTSNRMTWKRQNVAREKKKLKQTGNEVITKITNVWVFTNYHMRTLEQLYSNTTTTAKLLCQYLRALQTFGETFANPKM